MVVGGVVPVLMTVRVIVVMVVPVIVPMPVMVVVRHVISPSRG
jgi:hypothetical protein